MKRVGDKDTAYAARIIPSPALNWAVELAEWSTGEKGRREHHYLGQTACPKTWVIINLHSKFWLCSQPAPTAAKQRQRLHLNSNGTKRPFFTWFVLSRYSLQRPLEGKVRALYTSEWLQTLFFEHQAKHSIMWTCSVHTLALLHAFRSSGKARGLKKYLRVADGEVSNKSKTLLSVKAQAWPRWGLTKL